MCDRSLGLLYLISCKGMGASLHDSDAPPIQTSKGAKANGISCSGPSGRDAKSVIVPNSFIHGSPYILLSVISGVSDIVIEGVYYII